MGREARLRKEKIKAAILAEVDDWTRPATPEEAALLAEIEKFPTVIVHRVPDERLAWMRMEPRQCHVNCDFYEREDSEKIAKAIPGWWLQPNGIYMFHSVVSGRGGHMCMTPQAPNVPAVFEFAPDPKIKRVEVKGMVSFRRDGVDIPTMVRRDPERTIRAYTIIRNKILAGADPIKAMEIDWPS